MTAALDDEMTELRRANAELRQRLDERTVELELRTAERDEAHAQQTATAEVLQVINSSPGDLAPVFDAMLEKAMRLCDASMGVFARFDGNRFKPAVSRGVPPHYAEYLATTSEQPSPEGTNRRVLAGENVAHMIDVMEGVGYRSAHPWVRALVELGGARSLMTVALRKHGALLGTITLYRREVRAFTEKQIALLENFAAQAVIAMENARLLTETREALEQQTATAEVLQVINSSPGNLAPVFGAMLEKAMRLCDAAYGHLRIYDGERFHIAALRGAPAALEDFHRKPLTPVPGSPVGRLVGGETIIHVPDLVGSEAYRAGPGLTALVELGGARSYLLVALRKEEALLGYLVVYRCEVGAFTDQQIALLQNFAAQAVIAMENARLLTETRETLEQQTATAEVLGVINSSPGDLAPVFDAILEKAHSLCGAEYGGLATYDGECFRALTTRGYPEEYAAVLRQPFPPSTFHRALLDGEHFVHIADTTAIEWVPGNEPFRRAVEISGAGTSLLVPLRKDGTSLGLISAVRKEVRPFSDKQIALL